MGRLILATHALSNPHGTRSTASDVARSIVSAEFDHFLAFAKLVRGSEDPEAVHDMRVTCRRLRAALRMFETVLSGPTAALRLELKWVFDELGRVRDLDVAIDKIRTCVRSAEIQRVLSMERHTARTKLLAAIKSRRFSLLSEATQVMLDSVSPEAGRLPFEEMALERVSGPYERVRSLRCNLHSDADYHRLRRRSKDLRYDVEFIEPCFGISARRMANKLKDLQQLLGDRQDALMTLKVLNDLEDQLSEDKRLSRKVSGARKSLLREADTLTRRVPEALRKVLGRRWRNLRSHMVRSGVASEANA